MVVCVPGGLEIRIELAKDNHTVQRFDSNGHIVEEWDIETKEKAVWLMEQMALGSYRFDYVRLST